MAVLFSACSVDYKPNGVIPNEDDPIENIFPESINEMQSKVQLEFMNDSCRSISASYGDNDIIYYQIILVNEDFYDAKKCAEDYILPKFEKSGNFKTNYKGFLYYSSDETIEMSAWYIENYVFLMKTHIDYLELAIENNYYLTLL